LRCVSQAGGFQALPRCGHEVLRLCAKRTQALDVGFGCIKFPLKAGFPIGVRLGFLFPLSAKNPASFEVGEGFGRRRICGRGEAGDDASLR